MTFTSRCTLYDPILTESICVFVQNENGFGSKRFKSLKAKITTLVFNLSEIGRLISEIDESLSPKTGMSFTSFSDSCSFSTKIVRGRNFCILKVQSLHLQLTYST